MEPDYRLKNDWGRLKAGSVFKWKKRGYVYYEFDNDYIGIPKSFVTENKDLFEMVDPLKEKQFYRFEFMGYNQTDLMKIIDFWKDHHPGQ